MRLFCEYCRISTLLPKQHAVLSDKMIAHDLLGCTGPLEDHQGQAGGIRRHLQAFFPGLASSFLCSQAASTPTHLPCFAIANRWAEGRNNVIGIRYTNKELMMTESNVNSRLEAFCDGVFAIALTLLVIEIKIPASETINTTNDIWLALQHLLPSVFAFLLSFLIIFITWVNHRGTLKLINKSSPAFIYANGFLLLTIVVLPFPTALLSEHLFTDHAAPAVVLYAAITGLQAIGWILLGHTALKPNPLTINEKATLILRASQRIVYFALAIYTLLAIMAFWFPQVVAFLLGLIWFGWLIYGIRMKGE